MWEKLDFQIWSVAQGLKKVWYESYIMYLLCWRRAQMHQPRLLVEETAYPGWQKPTLKSVVSKWQKEPDSSNLTVRGPDNPWVTFPAGRHDRFTHENHLPWVLYGFPAKIFVWLPPPFVFQWVWRLNWIHYKEVNNSVLNLPNKALRQLFKWVRIGVHAYFPLPLTEIFWLFLILN